MPRPNVLIVMSDHHTGYALGPGSGVRTPQMDRLATEGSCFTEMRTPCPMCAPARAAVMSALYPHANGMWNNNHTPAAIRRDIYPHVRLWSQSLRAAGYRMRYIGKWHVSAERAPSAFGWEEPGLGAAARRPATSAQRQVTEALARPRANLQNALYQEREGWPPRVLYGATTAEEKDLPDARLTTRAVQLIEEQAACRDPWCLYVGWGAPHDPYVAHPRYLSWYDPAEIRRPASLDDDLRDKPNIYRRLREQLWGHLDWPDLAQMIRHFRAMISFLDAQLGRLLEALERTGQAENTIVLYTSDHGDYAGAHGLFAKGVPAFDEAYRVPFLLRWPAGPIRPGLRVDALCNLMDLGPTLLEAAGAEPLVQVHGRSLLPLLRDPQQPPADWPDAFHGEFLGHENLYTQRLVRTRTHKYVWNAFDYDELYDLTADPHEMHNVAADPAHGAVRRQLLQRIWAWVRATGDVTANPYPMNALAPLGPGILDG